MGHYCNDMCTVVPDIEKFLGNMADVVGKVGEKVYDKVESFVEDNWKSGLKKFKNALGDFASMYRVHILNNSPSLE